MVKNSLVRILTVFSLNYSFFRFIKVVHTYRAPKQIENYLHQFAKSLSHLYSVRLLVCICNNAFTNIVTPFSIPVDQVETEECHPTSVRLPDERHFPLCFNQCVNHAAKPLML